MDTIFALSSGAPPAAIAVLRVSGPEAGPAIEKLAGGLPIPRMATLRTLRDDGIVLDRALILWFPGPRTATGEDLAEFHLHGGRAVVAAVSRALAKLDGLRPAQPGEFARRAFANGVIDLAEAEGLADLLSAETESQRINAVRLAGGALSRLVEDWQKRILAMAAQVEAALDFDDEDDVSFDGTVLRSALNALSAEIRAMLDVPSAERLRDGIRVIIAGPPNAGKSTLLNALAGREAAIVSDEAGTTRDLVEVPVALGGMPIIFIDSAGLRDGESAVERIGIARARTALEAADVILWLDTAPCPIPHRAIRVAAKADLGAPPAGGFDIAVSARTGAGLAQLIDRIRMKCREILPTENELAIGARQRSALGAALADLLEVHTDPLLIAEQLRAAMRALDAVTGRAGVEHMLDMLFGRFCIGK